ncbi:M3 family oligoendopeptidase [Metabacillus sediminilitoris]|uniref:M3 family oligoendopeptidase n=1 Tax=Metabacillus sediminilitoris TaxID=2567941 RepID=A0A4S4C1K9_9BACI|nr:M3 family oligoendopeptidase [Metabacillus sediminilitoris]THF80970.1 M3 family oligoendopeptidase [Metabacillus sediminilitoris]
MSLFLCDKNKKRIGGVKLNTPIFKETWDLETFFNGGSHSSEFKTYLQEIDQLVNDLEQDMRKWPGTFSQNDINILLMSIKKISFITIKLEQANSFVGCLQAQDTSDGQANLLRSKLTSMSSAFTKVMLTFEQLLGDIEEDVWAALLKDSQLIEITYVLNEMRNRTKERLSVEKEQLIQDLSVDGYFGWEQLYDLLVAKIQIPFEENNEIKHLSVGQASNKFSDHDRNVRKSLFEKWETAWGSQADVFAETLNRLAGFRLKVYKERGWDDPLKEPLEINRMKKETLETMWQVISENKQPLVDYMKRKAKMLGVPKLSWYDVEAPVGEASSAMTYQEGAQFILKQFEQFGPLLTKFTKTAFEQQWIEAEDRPGKAPGGFCTSFPESDQSRIFMTFSGTPSNVSTLAHELGHAFHSYAMKDVHPLNCDYAMNVAETASTFAEMIVADAAVKQAKDKTERLALLEDKLQRSVALLMNIHARFLFETAFYEERKLGVVPSERLSELMVKAQKEAYCDSLEEYHPHFWASKLHFFITDVPFYNFPYTFGYLFSLGIYAKALEEGKAFEKKYIDLLKDTGAMTVEELAAKHLSVDLTKRDFWENAVAIAVSDVEDFMKLTNES